ncbi:hypothetical protein A6J60_000780 [Psychrobacter sp. FDAARGOS_221]|nr:hypothetical protein A6J60_000780 [Psychrobacter sp. FDAARGOS_221]
MSDDGLSNNALSHTGVSDKALINSVSKLGFKSSLAKAGLISAFLVAPLAANACQIPKSFYSNVFCTPSSQHFLALKDSGQPVALINNQGRPVADLTRYDRVDVSKLKDGVIPVQRYGKVGYINLSGREVIPPVYDAITNDSQTSGWSRASSSNRIVVKKGGKFGVIDTNNRVVVPFSASYQTISDYNGNLASARRNNQTQWLDINGRITNGPSTPVIAQTTVEPPIITSIPASSTSISNNRQGLAIPVAASSTQGTNYPAVTTSNKITVLNQNGSSSRLPTSVATPITPTNPGLANNSSAYNGSTPSTTVTTNATIRRLPSRSASGTATTPTTPTSIPSAEVIKVDQKPRPSPMDREVWQPEQRDGNWGFVNRSGVPMITFTFNQVTPFSEGLAGVRMQDKWGFINLAGELVIPFDYSESSVRRGNGATYKGVQPFVFTGGKAWVSNMPNGAQMCIDQEGRYVGC